MRLLTFALLVAAPAFSQSGAPAQAQPNTPPAAQGSQPAAAPGSQPAAGQPLQPAASPAGAAGWQANFDALWKERDQEGVLARLHQILEAPLALDKRSFEANWRLASLYNWEANQTEGDKKAGLGHKGWDAADIAIAVRPNDVRSQYFSATGLGLYAEGVGILTALQQGLEGKFRDRIGAALKLDKEFLDGAPQVVWGRFFFKLPWPKRDDNESIRILTPLLESHPKNLRAKLYLADSLTDEGSVDDARKLVQQILEAPLGEDPPETRLLKTQAIKWMASH
jgi:hypothetical protein